MTSIVDYVEIRKEELRRAFENLRETNGRKARLAIIQVGNNQASNAYVKGKLKDAESMSVETTLFKYADDENALEHTYNLLDNLNNDETINGILVQLPLPDGFDVKSIIEHISSEKDVDGFTRMSNVLPCTPRGVLDYMSYNGMNVVGKHCTIFGHSDIVGKPLANALMSKRAIVSVLNSSVDENLKRELLASSDYVFVAVGKRNVITHEYKLKKDAIVFDIGINRDENNKLIGDCERGLEVMYQSPVPKGVGLLTRIALYDNLLELIKREENKND